MQTQETENTQVTKSLQEGGGSTAGELGIIDIINMMLTFWWFIAILAILIGGSTYAYFKITAVPVYRSSASLMITTESQQTSTDVNTGAMTNAMNLLPTYVEVLKSKSFLTTVSDDLDNKYSVSEIKGMLDMSAVDSTNIITLNVSNPDAHIAYMVCSSLVNNAPSEIARVFGGGSTKLTEYPEESHSAETLHTARNSVVGFFAGALLAMVLIFLVNMFDTRVKNKDELITKYGLPILGEVPNLELN